MSPDAPSTSLPPLSPSELLAGKNILLLGTTGFLAKVMLSMMLERFALGKIYCLVRSQRSKTARERFFDEVAGSEMMEPLRRAFGPSFDVYLQEKIRVVDGDASKPNLGVTGDALTELQREVDIIVNSAGLVTFNPPLDDALEINSVGAREIGNFATQTRGKRVVHISTCFVAGNRSGHIREDEPVVGFFPKKDEMPEIEFDWAREVRDLERRIKETKDRVEDAALESLFKTEALARLKAEGRDPQPRTLRAAITNQRRRWVAEELIRIGLERAAHWGWPNIYTYTKALGEQALASTPGIEWSILRPSIVESSLTYPFPGWNEGMNTSAPLAYLGLNGQTAFPSGKDLILDVIPVDLVSSATLAVCASLMNGESGKVYQAAVGDISPVTMDRTITLVGLSRRRRARRDEDNKEISWLTARFREQTEPLPVPQPRFDNRSAPFLRRLTTRARKVLEGMQPERYGPMGGLVSDAQRIAQETETKLKKIEDIFVMFRPFIWENKYVFRTEQTRQLFRRMNATDQALLPYAPDQIDWRHYWLDVHIPGLEKWVFPKLDDAAGPKRMPIPRTHRDLAEMFESKTEEHARRIAFRILRQDDVADSYSYRDVRRAASAVAEFLRQRGFEKGGRVLLASESRPEWGISYFGILLAGGTAVPIDIDLSEREIQNIAGASKAVGVIASEKQKARLQAHVSLPLWDYDEVFEHAHDLPDELMAPVSRSPDDVASIIFTSGTTGRPKGVMLTDRNFTALTARVSALFHLNSGDSLLSVLPLHHTFEFSTGLMMPLSAGASVTYLEERTPELLARAFRETPPTSMVGVPAVWEALHRKIDGQLTDLVKPAELLVRMMMRGNRWLREHSPWNVGRWVFRPMHGALGGRLRMMVSGGAPLSPKIYDDFRGYGFSIYEGYGLTEASPVITVGWPRERTPAGSVGWPLPGLDVRIYEPDEQGIGQVIARGPTIMAGYLEDPAATAEVIRDGWLHTGDQGRLDDKGRLFIVGRQKDVIIDTGGKNVYPDEIEDLYRESSFVKELSVVGIPADQGTGERVAALVVPDYEAEEAKDLSKEEVRDRLRDHFREVGSKQPLARRIKVLHFWETELPRTATKKVKRSLVRDELVRLEAQIKKSRGGADEGISDVTSIVGRLVAGISQRTPGEIGLGNHLVDHLGFDSLMQMELLTAIEEEFPKARVSQEEMLAIDTVGDIVRLVARDRSSDNRKKTEVGDAEETPIPVPALVRTLGKGMLGMAQRLAHERLLDIEVEGQGNIPANTNFIVASNHSSHLDMGLVKHALGDLAGELMAVAAKDYFFDDRIRRLYFENFTNLLPMDRHGSLKKSLRLAGEALRQGSSLLIFPEGTRSRDGVMSDFKPAVGYLCLHEKIDILPIALVGTHDALPVGTAVPKGRKLGARIGPPIRAEEMLKETEHLSRAAAYRHVARIAEQSVRRLLGQAPSPALLDAEPSVSKKNGANGPAAHHEKPVVPSRVVTVLDSEGS